MPWTFAFAQVTLHKVFLGGIKNAGSGFVPARDHWWLRSGPGVVPTGPGVVPTGPGVVLGVVPEWSHRYPRAHFITFSIDA